VLLLTIKKVNDRGVHGEATINVKQHAHVDEFVDMTVKPVAGHIGSHGVAVNECCAAAWHCPRIAWETRRGHQAAGACRRRAP
jgi:hypothetical protein